ncbi:hypothetical protein WL387_12025, partial [Staphylococcus epidermidis]
GNTKVTFSDGHEITFAKGDKGDKGDSVTVAKVEPQPNGDTKVTFSDGKEIVIPKGEKGDPGKDGVDGKDAAPLTVTSTEKDADGNTII